MRTLVVAMTVLFVWLAVAGDALLDKPPSGPMRPSAIVEELPDICYWNVSLADPTPTPPPAWLLELYCEKP